MLSSKYNNEKYIAIENGKYKVWAKKMGAGGMSMLCLHGGPGASHDYLTCLDKYLLTKNITYYYYDQLGSGKSDKPHDVNLWNLKRFVLEVEQVRAKLGLDKIILYGQSWGGLLAIEYALHYPENIAGLIISNMTASVPSYVEHLNQLRTALPKEKQTILEKYEKRGEYDAPEYIAVMVNEVYARYLCRLNPMPEIVAKVFETINPEVYNTMQGPNEFVVYGNLKDWDRWSSLSKITAPTLILGGKYDTMSPQDLEKMATIMPNAQTIICPQGSHLAMYDDPQPYFAALLNFLEKLYLKNNLVFNINKEKASI